MNALLRLIAAALLLALPVMAPARPAPGPARPVFALVIGINAYTGAPPLRGAVNDARSIADALRKSAAREVVVLLDGEATRQRILDEIKRLGETAARESGTLIITYAGHGSQEPEKIAGDEVDGMDEILVLAGFRSNTPDNAQRIRDNDIYQVLKAIPKNVDVLFVADACHSGTLTRSADFRVAPSTRLAKYGPIVNDALAPPPVSTKAGEAEDLPNVVFVASALDNEVTPELLIEGNWHGAVSWYFAKALGGAADSDGDGVTTFAEFRVYLVNKARMIAESHQTPTVHYNAGRGLDSFPAPAARMAKTQDDRPSPLTVWTLGDGTLPSGVAAAASRETADLIWDRGNRQMIANGNSDVVAEQGLRQAEPAFVAGVADKWRAMPRLRQLVSSPVIPLDILPRGAGARYTGGIVKISIGPRPSPLLRYLTVVDIAGDGTVQNLFPYPGRPAEAGMIEADRNIESEARVQPPYGADHIIVIASADEPQALRDGLRAMEGRQAASEAVRLIEGAIKGKADVVGLVGLYSGSDGVPGG